MIYKYVPHHSPKDLYLNWMQNRCPHMVCLNYIHVVRITPAYMSIRNYWYRCIYAGSSLVLIIARRALLFISWRPGWRACGRREGRRPDKQANGSKATIWWTHGLDEKNVECTKRPPDRTGTQISGQVAGGGWAGVGPTFQFLQNMIHVTWLSLRGTLTFQVIERTARK